MYVLVHGGDTYNMYIFIEIHFSVCLHSKEIILNLGLPNQKHANINMYLMAMGLGLSFGHSKRF